MTETREKKRKACQAGLWWLCCCTACFLFFILVLLLFKEVSCAEERKREGKKDANRLTVVYICGEVANKVPKQKEKSTQATRETRTFFDHYFFIFLSDFCLS